MNVFSMKRGWMNDPFFDDGEPYTKKEAWLWLMERARFKDGEKIVINGRKTVLKRGQLSDSLRHLSKQWNWPTALKAHRYLKRLEAWGKIEMNNETGQNIITICDYDKNQLRPDFNETQNGTGKKSRGYDSETNKNKGNMGNKENKLRDFSDDEAWKDFAQKLGPHSDQCRNALRSCKVADGGKTVICPNEFVAANLRNEHASTFYRVLNFIPDFVVNEDAALK